MSKFTTVILVISVSKVHTFSTVNIITAGTKISTVATLTIITTMSTITLHCRWAATFGSNGGALRATVQCPDAV